MASRLSRIKILAVFVVAWSVIPTIVFGQIPDVTPLLDWGHEVAVEIDATLLAGSGPLYAETAHANGTQSGGVGGTAFAWPLSTQFRVLNSLARYNPTKYSLPLKQFSNAFHNQYWSPAGGYYCCKGGGDRFYDDNAHIAVALAEAYEITGDPVYLSRAEATYSFLLTGEAPGQNGGSYWSVNDHTFLDSSAALQGARAGAMLFQATGNDNYLNDAILRYEWAKNTTQLADGTFMEKLFLTGPQAGQIGNYPLVNFAGQGISANVELYQATGAGSYLSEARRISRTSVAKYFSPTNGSLNDETFWAFEMVDALADLYDVDHYVGWINALATSMTWAHDNKADPEGHYGLFFGREGPQVGTLESWDLNNQAAVARAFLRTALLQAPTVQPGSSGDFNHSATVDGADFLIWQRGLGQNLQWDRRHGDANLDGVVNPTDLLVWNLQYGPAPPNVTEVPESASFALALAGAATLVVLMRIERRASRGRAIG